jgi:hypothetical protein
VLSAGILLSAAACGREEAAPTVNALPVEAPAVSDRPLPEPEIREKAGDTREWLQW